MLWYSLERSIFRMKGVEIEISVKTVSQKLIIIMKLPIVISIELSWIINENIKIKLNVSENYGDEMLLMYLLWLCITVQLRNSILESEIKLKF